ncbi:MAG: hypothetical protein K2J63_13695, partial [Muribaculaceae bacterium]|nr:hypothetical protein [Muribaculaceae bacterium]
MLALEALPKQIDDSEARPFIQDAATALKEASKRNNAILLGHDGYINCNISRRRKLRGLFSILTPSIPIIMIRTVDYPILSDGFRRNYCFGLHR